MKKLIFILAILFAVSCTKQDNTPYMVLSMTHDNGGNYYKIFDGETELLRSEFELENFKGNRYICYFHTITTKLIEMSIIKKYIDEK